MKHRRSTGFPQAANIQMMTLTSTKRTMILIPSPTTNMTSHSMCDAQRVAREISPVITRHSLKASIGLGGSLPSPGHVGTAASAVPSSEARQRFVGGSRAQFITCLLCSLLTLTSLCLAQAQRGTLVHEASIRVSPSSDSAKLGTVERGYELVIIDSSRDWAHVEAILRDPSKNPDDEDDDEAQGKTITGWLPAKALVGMSTPNGDKIVFGEAADSEDEASRRRGRKDAAQDAMRLYYRVYDLFPASPLAGEGLYRAADIRWQIERSDIMTRPSAREREAYMRGQINEEWMKLVMKKFSGTKWADLAAFHLIENKLCGDWQAASKCPDKEADMYEKYAKEHQQSPAAPQALYQAARRRSALIEIYKTEANPKKAEESKNRALGLSQQILSQYGQSDWANRAQTLIFYVQQGVPTYGNASD